MRVANVVLAGAFAVTAALAGCVSKPGTPIPASMANGPWVMHTIDNYYVNGGHAGADGTRLGDINKDGLPDITTGWEEGSVTRVYINPGPAKAKNSWPSVTVSDQSVSIEDAFFADVDGDGVQDVVSSCEGEKKSVLISWAPKKQRNLLNPAKWKTEAIPCTVGVTRWMFGSPLQIDGMNGIDLVVGAKEHNAMIAWLKAPADPHDVNGWKLFKLTDCDWVMSLLVHDMNGDGIPDIVYSDRRTISWLENPGPNGDVEHPWKKHLIFEADDHSISCFLSFADLDKDGLEDILCAYSRDGRIKNGPNGQNGILYARRLDKSGENWETHMWGPYERWMKDVHAVDVNQDGKVDLMMSTVKAYGSPEVESGVVWAEIGEGFPANPVLIFHDIAGTPGTKYDLLVPLDVDGDGDIDAITSEEAQAIGDAKIREGLGVIWYENPLK